ncbi:MAG: hypothetical protein ACFFC6_12625, partial [Promethearchaeota archaeon]
MTTEPLTKKYRRFVVGGFSRVLISRTFSFLYVIIVTRLIIKGTMDQMIILASGQLIILQVTSLAMRFSCRQRALSVKGEKSDEFRYNGVLFMLFIATPISIILAVIMALYVGGFEYTVLLISYPLSMALIMLMETEIMVEKSLLAADRAILLNMVFSVLNSIMVPLFYFIAPTLASVLWAWNFSLVLTVLLDIKVILRILQKKRLSSQVITYLIHFGFPIYLGQLPQLISTHINNFVIFEFLETGATSIFYWPN